MMNQKYPTPPILYKEIILTKGYVAFVSPEDYERVNKYSWYADVGRWNVYAKCDNVDGQRMRMHQFVLKQSSIDHKDRNGLNNTRPNIIKKSQSANNHNGKFQRNGTSGIWWNEKLKRYEITLTVNYKKHYIGVTKCLTEAKQMRQAARVRFGLELADLAMQRLSS